MSKSNRNTSESITVPSESAPESGGGRRRRRRKVSGVRGRSKSNAAKPKKDLTIEECIRDLKMENLQTVRNAAKKLNNYLMGLDDLGKFNAAKERGEIREALGLLLNKPSSSTISTVTVIVRKLTWLEDGPMMKWIYGRLIERPSFDDLSEDELVATVSAYIELMGSLSEEGEAKMDLGPLWKAFFMKPHEYYTALLSQTSSETFFLNRSTAQKDEILKQITQFVCTYPEDSNVDPMLATIEIQLVRNAINGCIVGKLNESVRNDVLQLLCECIKTVDNPWIRGKGHKGDPDTLNQMSISNACLLEIFHCVKEMDNKEPLRWDVVEKNLQFLTQREFLAWAPPCKDGEDLCECEVDPLTSVIHDLLLAWIPMEQPKLLADDVAELVKLFKNHKQHELLDTIAQVYPFAREEVNDEFESIFEIGHGLEFREGLYHLTTVVARYTSEVMKAEHAEQLESYLLSPKVSSNELLPLLKTMCAAAENNRKIFKGRGSFEYYHAILGASGDDEELWFLVNNIFNCIAFVDEAEARRMLDLMLEGEKFFGADSFTKHCLANLQEMACVYPTIVFRKKNWIQAKSQIPSNRKLATELLTILEPPENGKGCSLM